MKILRALSHDRSPNPNGNGEGPSGGGGDASAPGWPGSSDGEWEFPRHQLKVVSKIGEGCFGQVWKYEATEGVPGFSSKTASVTVAVKTLRSNATEGHKRDLLNELAMMKMLDPHPNVVRLLGCCTEKGAYNCISGAKSLWAT